MIALAAGGSAHRSRPLIRIWPASGRSRPVIIDSEVVFPAPFGPTSPAKEPAAISRSIPATASFSPKLLRSPRTLIAGPLMITSLAGSGAPVSVLLSSSFPWGTVASRTVGTGAAMIGCGVCSGPGAEAGPSVRQFRSRSGRNRVRAVMKARIFDTTFNVIGSADCG